MFPRVFLGQSEFTTGEMFSQTWAFVILEGYFVEGDKREVQTGFVEILSV